MATTADEPVLLRIFERGSTTTWVPIMTTRNTIRDHTKLNDITTLKLHESFGLFMDIQVAEKSAALLWVLILNKDEKGLEALNIKNRHVFNLIEFKRTFIKSNDEITEKFHAWFTLRWNEYKKVLTAPTGEKQTWKLLLFTVQAAEMREPAIFRSASNLWFLHSKGVETTDDFSLNRGLRHLRPVLTNIMAARTGFVNKLVKHLAYDRKNDGRVKSRQCPSEVCAANTFFAYYQALYKTSCWPVWDAAHKLSIQEMLDGLKNFKYIPCSKLAGLHPDDTKKHMPPRIDDNGKKVVDPKCICDEACFRVLEKKVRGASNALLCKWDKNRRVDCFRGMCLDCVLNTKGEDMDCKYWGHVGNGIFDEGCTFKHGQPDWYYSFMGSREVLRAYRDTEEHDKFLERIRSLVI